MSSAVYEVDHLATLPNNSLADMRIEDGLRQLQEMELRGDGVWTLPVELRVDGQQIAIFDKISLLEIASLQLTSVTGITASNKESKNIYGNVLALNVTSTPSSPAPKKMYIFHCCENKAQDIAEDIRIAKHLGQTPNKRKQHGSVAKKEKRSSADDLPETGSQFTEAERNQHYVKIFNHCLDDIEKYVSQLQEAARSYANKRQMTTFTPSYDNINLASKEPFVPTGREFIDILQKFKLAFNLLAKLKDELKDPSAVDLVRFLFSTLSLVAETSRDPVKGTLNIVSSVVSPLLARSTLVFLNSCMTATEKGLLSSLGDAWNISRESWQNYVPPFFPTFKSGFQPPPSWLDERPSSADNRAQINAQRQYSNDSSERNYYNETNGRHSSSETNGQQRYSNDTYEQERYSNDTNEKRQYSNDLYGQVVPRQRPNNFSEDNQRNGNNLGKQSRRGDADLFFQQLRQRGSEVAKVAVSRNGNNDKELTITEGEILEVLDRSKNWWKLRNNRNEVGFAPYTALKLLA